MGAACGTTQLAALQESIEDYQLDSLKPLKAIGVVDTVSSLDIERPAIVNVRSQWGPPASFTRVAECLSVLLGEIGSFLAGSPTASCPHGGSPQDLVRAFCLTSRTVNKEAAFAMDGLWEQAYMNKWPAFHQAVSFHSQKQDWRRIYQETHMGRCECTLEVFDREKKPGFAMAAMPARIQFEPKLNGYIARYISASPVRPELIPMHEAHRVRFCPLSVRDSLQPFGVSMLPGLASHTSRDARVLDAFLPSKITQTPQTINGERPSKSDYPYRVLDGKQELIVGRGVELQWKMQEHSPFGWWYGTVEALRKERDQYGERSVATITFGHFPKNSLWYRIDVRFGDGQMHPCSFGGTTGGIRMVSLEEDALWKRFFPKQPIVA